MSSYRKKVVLVFAIVSIIQFAYFNTQNSKLYKEAPPKLIKVLDLTNDSNRAEIKHFLNAIFWGETQNLPQEWKEKFRLTNLNHLFSPSGIHFTALAILLIPLDFSKIGKKINTIIHFLILLLCFCPIHPSFKRAALYRSLRFMGKRWIKLENDEIYFHIVFFFDFLIGTFKTHPLSFTYSYLFWAIFIIRGNRWEKFIFFVIAQIYVCSLNQQTFYVFSILAGLFLTSFFSPLFLIFTFLAPLSIYFYQLKFIIISLIKFYLSLVDKLSDWVLLGFAFRPSSYLIFAVILFFLLNTNKLKNHFICFIIFLFLPFNVSIDEKHFSQNLKVKNIGYDYRQLSPQKKLMKERRY